MDRRRDKISGIATAILIFVAMFIIGVAIASSIFEGV
jgi:hypothetical protein